MGGFQKFLIAQEKYYAKPCSTFSNTGGLNPKERINRHDGSTCLSYDRCEVAREMDTLGKLSFARWNSVLVYTILRHGSHQHDKH